MKKILLTVLCTIMFTALAATAVCAQEFKLSNHPDESIAFTLGDGKIIVSDLPASERFNFLYMFLTTPGNPRQEQFTHIYARKDGESSVEWSVAGIPNGLYYINIFFSPVRESVFRGYIWDNQLTARFENGRGAFVLPQMYTHNRTVYKPDAARDELEYYLQPTERAQSSAPMIASLAARITEDIEGDYEKLRAVHDWVCDNIWYDYDMYYRRAPARAMTAQNVLADRRSVCEGFSQLTAALLRSLGIPTRLVVGNAIQIGSGALSRTYHMWNEAFVDDRWVILDTTWNTDNKYENGRYSEGTGLFFHRFFDMSLEFLSTSHEITEYVR